MTTIKNHVGYVITEDDIILLQLPADNQWGFVLADDDQSWPGGFGIASRWEAIDDDDPRISTGDRDYLQCWLDEARSEG